MVDLPAPDSPISPSTLPRCSVSDTSSTIGMSRGLAWRRSTVGFDAQVADVSSGVAAGATRAGGVSHCRDPPFRWRCG